MAGFSKIAVACALLCASVVSFGQVKNRILQPIDKSQMVRLRGNVHPLTRVGTDLGRLDGSAQLKEVTLLFNQSASQKAALQTLIQQQRDPSSPNYHKWLTPEEYGARFGMSQDDLNKVTDWLKSQGFTLNNISNSRTRIAFNGTVAQVESAFKTEFHQYKVDGEVHLANATEPSIPAALSGSVMGFWKMDNFRWKPRAVVKGVSPRFTFGSRTALAPGDIATIYNVAPLYAQGITGQGQRIAVVGQTSINLNDINSFRNNAGLPVNPPVIFLLPGETPTLNQDDEVEADLDVEWSGAIAKDATIIYVYKPFNSGNGVIDAFTYAIDKNIAPVVSISYGACEPANGQSFITFLENLMAEADTQGQSVSSSIGDSGATDCEPVTTNATVATTGLSVDVPGAIPDVTSVGGTRFTTDDSANPAFWTASNDPSTGASAIQYIPETTWNDGFTSATGGGVSSLIPKPSFQTALTPADGHRDVPDIAFSASPDHDPYLVCDAHKSTASCAGGFVGNAILVGGTSAGAPTFAGMLALLNQVTENSAGQGSINTELYSLAGNPAIYADSFHDITTGNNKQTCQGGSTGCTSANSHVVAEERHSTLPITAVLFLIPLGAVVVTAGRRRVVAGLSMVLLAAAFSMQIACGGGSSNNNNNNGNTNPPPPNLSIGWSAGVGYDLVTGLGSVNLDKLASHWTGFTNSPGFSLSATQVTAPTTSVPGTYTITLTRTSSSFSDNVDISCITTGNATGDAQATCSRNPTTRTLNGGAQTGTSTLTVNIAQAGIYSVLVKAQGENTNISHTINVPITVN